MLKYAEQYKHFDERQHKMGAYVYLLRCSDDTLYCGWTDDPARRAASHNAGHGAKYTRSRLPVKLVYTEACADKSEALRREAAIKRMTRAQKLQLIETGKNTDD